MKNTGLTILELLFALAIIALLALVGSSSFHSISLQLLHKAQAELLVDFLQQSRHSAIHLQRDVYVSVNTQGSCLGASHAPLCDCTVLDACTLAGTEQVAHIDGAILSLAQPRFANAQQYRFESRLGTAVGYNGSFVLSSAMAESRLILSALGRVRQCMLNGQLSGVASC